MNLIFIFLLALIILGAAAFLILEVSITIIGHYFGAPFIRSKKDKIRAMLEIADIKPGETAVDLGSGDGSLVIEAARAGAKGIGVEINPLLVWYSRFKSSRLGLNDHTLFICKNFKKFSLRDADVVFIYLWPETIEKLKQKLSHELRPGARIVSNSFPIKGWMPIIEEDKIYLYRIRN